MATTLAGNAMKSDKIGIAPRFAVEVRSDGDYGPAAERKMAMKRQDYFATGTLVVWDVDLLSDDVVRVYRAISPQEPTIYRRGDHAEADPAAPGWTMPVCEIDLRVGGSYRYLWRHAAGQEMGMGGIYREIAPPELRIGHQQPSL